MKTYERNMKTKPAEYAFPTILDQAVGTFFAGVLPQTMVTVVSKLFLLYIILLLLAIIGGPLIIFILLSSSQTPPPLPLLLLL